VASEEQKDYDWTKRKLKIVAEKRWNINLFFYNIKYEMAFIYIYIYTLSFQITN
jgi:hypothetical protein